MTPKKIFLFAIGPLAAAFLGIISLPLITWFFSQEDVGKLAMLQIALNFSVLLFSLGLDQAYVREFHYKSNKARLLRTVAAPGLLLLLLSLIFINIINKTFLSEFLFSILDFRISFLISLAILANFISRYLALILRMNERGLAYSITQMMPKITLILIIGIYLLVDVERDIYYLLLANTIALVTVVITFCWNTRYQILESFNERIIPSELKKLLHYSLPLVLSGLAYWGLTATDKIMLRTLSNFESLAIYSVAVSLAGAAGILQAVFSTVWAPIVYKQASEGKGISLIHKVSQYITLIVTIIFSLFGIFSWMIKFLLPSNYSSVQWVVLSCLGLPLLYTLSETTVIGIGISKRSSLAFIAALAGFIGNLILNWFLIPLYGASGAAASTCLSFLIFFVLRTELAVYAWEPIPRKKIYVYTCINVFGATFFTLFGPQFPNLNLLYWISVLISTTVFFKDEFRNSKDWFIDYKMNKSQSSIQD